MKLPKAVNVGGIERPKFRLMALPDAEVGEKNLNEIFGTYYGDADWMADIDDILLRVGVDINKLFEEFLPVPIEHILPYSIRSVILQLGREHSCYYACKYDRETWKDACISELKIEKCILASGLRKKELSCQMLNGLLEICETDEERNFLKHYLTEAYLANAGGEFPMLIPQVWVGRRHRADFALFIPLEEDNWEYWAIEVDERIKEDKEEYLRELGFNVYWVMKNRLLNEAINLVGMVWKKLKDLGVKWELALVSGIESKL